MITFATTDDLGGRHAEPLTEAEIAIASAKLVEASARMQVELEAAGVDWRSKSSSSEAYAATLAAVACAMVERSMASAAPGLKSRQQSAGPYSFTDSYANPTGDLYLLASERRSLGIGRARMGIMVPRIGGGD